VYCTLLVACGSSSRGCCVSWTRRMRARWRRSAPRRVRTPCDCRIQADWTAICVRYREPSQGNVWVSGRSASCLSAGILQSDNGPFTLHAGTRVFARVCACSVKDPYFTAAHVAIVAVSRSGYYGYLGFMKFTQNSVHHNFVAKNKH